LSSGALAKEDFFI